MQLFQHYIITRFNLRMFDKIRNGSIVDICDENYLKRRMDIFEKYTLPSIQNQSDQNFKWLVLFDSETPSSIKERIRLIESSYHNFIACYIDSAKYAKETVTDEYIVAYERYAIATGIERFDNIKQSSYMQSFIIPMFLRTFLSNLNIESKYVITTRIDNDDMFHPRMIEDIHKRVAVDDSASFYNYTRGYQVLINEGIAQCDFVAQNHFTTLVEETPKFFYSVLYWDHRYVKEFNSYTEIECEPLWVELIHDLNVANNLNYRRPRNLIFSNKEFDEYPMLDGFRINIIKTLRAILKNTFPINVLYRVINHIKK